MTCRRDRGNGIQTIVRTGDIPRRATLQLTIEHHVKTVIRANVGDLPIRAHAVITKAHHRRPRALGQRFVQRCFVGVRHDQPFVRNRAHEVVKLYLNRCQIRENIGMVEFEIIQNRRARTVVHKLTALVEKRGVVLIRLNHEKRIVGQTCRDAKVTRHAADQKARVQTGVFEQPREHRAGGGFAMRARDGEHPFVAQNVFAQPLRAGNVGQALIQNRFHQRIAARNDVTHHEYIRFQINLRRIKAADQFNTLLF